MTITTSNMPATRNVVVAPMASGKTTFAAGQPGVFDSDDARVEAHEPQLKELRRASKWAEHNAIWHDDLRRWAQTLSPDAIVLAHSLEDAIALGATPDSMVFVVPDETTHLERMTKRDLDSEGIQLALLNREQNIAKAAAYKRPVITDFPRDRHELEALFSNPTRAHARHRGADEAHSAALATLSVYTSLADHELENGSIPGYACNLIAAVETILTALALLPPEDRRQGVIAFTQLRTREGRPATTAIHEAVRLALEGISTRRSPPDAKAIAATFQQAQTPHKRDNEGVTVP